VIVILFAIIQAFIIQLFALAFCSVLILLIANLVCQPIEQRIAKNFLKKAKRKLKLINPTVIAITGSYGKTSLKNILAQILSTQYSVCASPKSFNTPMGLARCINENLKNDDRIFIAEAGARYKGDIGEICNFLSPKIAIITAIGNQHLSTFKSLKTLQKEKFSIISDSVESAFINADAVKDVSYMPKGKNITITGKNEMVNYSEIRIENGVQKFIIHGKK
jgi:UDP-N-acetylmuramoyl-tripeptide--D-alanyl-D-alanine ligase